ncbi:50S ribosomal protein L31e, partial [Candidatus Woesearchaeota archaeon]|nr:50S ribosomal protein L31e [Candidatus Woesearchaeota archaeon]
MAEEKQFVIPLRKEFQKGPSYKKSEKAIKAIREFIMRHMKTDSVKIGRNLNLKIFEHGRKNPPPKIKIKAIKEENIVRVELPEFPFETKVEKKESKTKKSEKAPEKIEEIKEVK